MSRQPKSPVFRRKAGTEPAQPASSRLGQRTRTKSPQAPPPSLFQPASSPNTSIASVPSGFPPAPLLLSGSTSVAGGSPSRHIRGSSKGDMISPLGSPYLQPARLSIPLTAAAGGGGDDDADSTDLLWREMQNTLAQVEVSAAANDSVFNPSHLESLQQLRSKQLALAKAWARSEVDEVVEHSGEETSNVAAPSVSAAGSRAPPQMSLGVQQDLARRQFGTTESEDIQSAHVLDEKTENDLALARRRREANDHYFDRVSSGVLDVVSTLEDVALALRAVERESNDIWSDSEESEIHQYRGG
ncbi:hypothetical protein KEM54_003799 [Ascosphaera aggregata]|nr:hypothetical protein KEM54_003799 [Ascosphaera aggregata]